MGDPFDTVFWPNYPRKEKKIAARDALSWALKHHNPDGLLMERIGIALAWQFELNPDWHYWTTPEKWILAQRWTDEPPRKPAPADWMREQYDRWQHANRHDPKAAAVSLETFKAYAEDRRRRK